MAKKSDDLSALLATGLVGFGLGLAAASVAQRKREEQRARVRNSLAHALGVRGYKLLSASVGRSRNNAAFWALTVADSSKQLRTLRVQLAPTEDPFSESAVQRALKAV